MIVETDQMQPCGEGTPMFSRYGKQTSNEYKCFTESRITHVRSSIMDSASKYESGTRMKKEDIDFVLEKLKVSKLALMYFSSNKISLLERGHG
jgi:hypothetical protein